MGTIETIITESKALSAFPENFGQQTTWDSHTATVRCDYCSSTIIVPETLRRDGRPSSAPAGGQAQLLAEIAQLVEKGQKIQAIKLFRDTFDTGLREAKEVVDAIERHEAIRLDDVTIVAGVTSPPAARPAAMGRFISCLILAIVLITGLAILIPTLVGGGLAFFAISSVSLLSTQIPEVIAGSTQPPQATATPGLAAVVWQMGGQEGIGPGFFDVHGNLTLEVRDPFSNIPNFATINEDLAVDGAGNIYVLGTDAIYKFDAAGRFVNQIGSRGEAADQFSSSVTAIAVDGRGRIYAEDFKGILVFDANGRYLGTIDFRGVAFDMLIDDRNELLVMDRNGNQVLRYAMNE